MIVRQIGADHQHPTYRNSSDHLIRPRQHVRWDGETNPLRGFEVDRQVDFRRLLHWEIGGLFALQERGGGAGCWTTGR